MTAITMPPPTLLTQPKTVLIVQGNSAYDSLSAFDLEVARCLKASGYEPILLPPDWNKWGDNFNAAMARSRDFGGVLCAIGFNGIGVEIGEPHADGPIWQRLHIPFIAWLGDHPTYALRRHRHSSPWIVRAYAAPDFCTYQTRHIRASGRNAVVPFGALDYGVEPARRASGAPLILCPKSVGDPGVIEKFWNRQPKMLRDALHAAAHAALAPGASEPLDDLALRAAHAHGLYPEHDQPLLSFLMAQLDDYVRRRRAVALLEALLPYPVTLCGNGVEPLAEGKSARAAILPPQPYARITAMAREATALVSMNPNIQHGPHDRVWTALGVGALPLSDRNAFLMQHCPEVKDYLYDWKEVPTIGAVVEKIIAAPKDAQDIAWNLTQRWRIERPFSKAVEELLDLARLTRALIAGITPPEEQNYFMPDPRP